MIFVYICWNVSYLKKMNICLCIKKLLEKNKFISDILYVYIFIKIGFS